MTFDLVVVGGGIVGAACALAATKANLRVALIESDCIGGGATAAGMGHLVAMDDDPAEFALVRRSLELWRNLGCSPRAEYVTCGTVWVAEDSEELALVDARCTRLKSAGIQADALDAQALYELEPGLVPGLAGGLVVPSDAIVYAPYVARWLVERACASGAQVFMGHQVSALKGGGARLDNGTTINGPVLVACGCGTPALLPEMVMRPRKGHLVITERYPPIVRHQVVELGYIKSVQATAQSSVACNVQPRPTGQLLIGASREFINEEDHGVSQAVVGTMLKRVFRFFPTLRNLKVLRIWTGSRAATPDGLPYIGPVPDRPDVWVASGHEGLGITTSLGTAELLIDQLLGRESAIDSKPYAPARVMR